MLGRLDSNAAFSIPAASAAFDGYAQSNFDTVTITIGPINDAPVADDIFIETDEDIDVEITLTGSDVEGSALIFEVMASYYNKR